MAPLLRVDGLRTQFFTSSGTVKAVDGVSFEVNKGETVGIVGESGCGKSVTALSLLRLIPEPGKIVSGQILFNGLDVLQMSHEELREFRGNDVAMIFQDPMTSLNPVLRVGFQIKEAMVAHERFDKATAEERIVPLVEKVRIPAAKERAKNYPHQFSGGMRQRAMIAMGLGNEPGLLIADEPTTALDVTVQAQIIELLRDLNRETGTAIILISHNLAVVASLCTHVLVMYAGRVVEQGPTREIFYNPQHPYTWALLNSVPRIDAARHEDLVTIAGLPPDLTNPPPGCKFHPRCRFRIDSCFHEPEPMLSQVGPAHFARCWVMMKNVPSSAEASS